MRLQNIVDSTYVTNVNGAKLSLQAAANIVRSQFSFRIGKQTTQTISDFVRSVHIVLNYLTLTHTHTHNEHESYNRYIQ